jgi:hypothetical protein
MLFAGNETREEIIALISSDQGAFDNIVAMANVGAAFSQIYLLEDYVAILVSTSKVVMQQKLSKRAIEASDLFMEKHRSARSSTLGRLIDAIEKSGVEGRDIRYLRAIVELRNDFVHRLGDQVPLPGDWERYGYSLRQFSRYTRYVLRHVNTATRVFSRIMVRHGLLAGKFGDFGGMLWNPDDPFLSAVEGDDLSGGRRKT